MNSKFLYVGLLLHTQVYAGDLPKLVEANNLYQRSKYKQAAERYDKIIPSPTGDFSRQTPEILEGMVNYGDVHAALGDWKQACHYWQARIYTDKFARKSLDKAWDYRECNNKKIVVYSEHENGAFGDTFIMLPLLKRLYEYGADITFVSQKPLEKFCRLQGYINQVITRSEKLEEYDSATYLWSVLNYYFDKKETPFPMQPQLTAPQLPTGLKRLFQSPGIVGKLLVGFWYRGSGIATAAAENRSLARDPGANTILNGLRAINDIVLICLEGQGHYPIINLSKDFMPELEKSHDELDSVEEYEDLLNVVVMPKGFDGNQTQLNLYSHLIPSDLSALTHDTGAFIDSATVMRYIKEQDGVLVGCDTGLLMLAANIKGCSQKDKPSVLALTNKQRDFRWGLNQKKQEDGTRKPALWNLSHEVKVFQCVEQNEWEKPMNQIREEIIQRVAIHNK